MRLVIAVGGNALLRRGEDPDAGVQEHHVRDAARQLAPVVPGNEVVLCHGNGPQIGMLAMESENDAALSRPYPLDALGAQTQGLIGYWMTRELTNAGVTSDIAVVLTQTVVDADDPAFTHPTKFVGTRYPPDLARQYARDRGWSIAADTGGWRRVVPSPRPLGFVERDTIARLIADGAVVVCAGGGGAPVVRRGGRLTGVEAVVDKDLAAAVLAIELNADRLVLLTDVEAVMDGFGTPAARAIDVLDADDVDADAFAAGSMGPKVNACAEFASRTGHAAIIGSLDSALDVIAGRAGTTVRASRRRGPA